MKNLDCMTHITATGSCLLLTTGKMSCRCFRVPADRFSGFFARFFNSQDNETGLDCDIAVLVAKRSCKSVIILPSSLLRYCPLKKSFPRQKNCRNVNTEGKSNRRPLIIWFCLSSLLKCFMRTYCILWNQRKWATKRNSEFSQLADSWWLGIEGTCKM